VLKIEVAESVDQLKEMLEKQRYDTQRSKVQVLWWLKTGQAQQVNQLTHLSGYHLPSNHDFQLALEISSGRTRCLAGGTF
jgi:hypothetical protein